MTNKRSLCFFNALKYVFVHYIEQYYPKQNVIPNNIGSIYLFGSRLHGVHNHELSDYDFLVVHDCFLNLEHSSVNKDIKNSYLTITSSSKEHKNMEKIKDIGIKKKILESMFVEPSERENIEEENMYEANLLITSQSDEDINKFIPTVISHLKSYLEHTADELDDDDDDNELLGEISSYIRDILKKSMEIHLIDFNFFVDLIQQHNCVMCLFLWIDDYDAQFNEKDYKVYHSKKPPFFYHEQNKNITKFRQEFAKYYIQLRSVKYSFFSKADIHCFFKAKREFKRNSFRKARKNLVHGVRYLMYARQIVKYGRIRNLFEANTYYDELNLMKESYGEETTIHSSAWNDLEHTYGKIYKSLRKEITFFVDHQIDIAYKIADNTHHELRNRSIPLRAVQVMIYYFGLSCISNWYSLELVLLSHSDETYKFQIQRNNDLHKLSSIIALECSDGMIIELHSKYVHIPLIKFSNNFNVDSFLYEHIDFDNFKSNEFPIRVLSFTAMLGPDISYLYYESIPKFDDLLLFNTKQNIHQHDTYSHYLTNSAAMVKPKLLSQVFTLYFDQEWKIMSRISSNYHYIQNPFNEEHSEIYPSSDLYWMFIFSCKSINQASFESFLKSKDSKGYCYQFDLVCCNYEKLKSLLNEVKVTIQELASCFDIYINEVLDKKNLTSLQVSYHPELKITLDSTLKSLLFDVFGDLFIPCYEYHKVVDEYIHRNSKTQNEMKSLADCMLPMLDAINNPICDTCDLHPPANNHASKKTLHRFLSNPQICTGIQIIYPQHTIKSVSETFSLSSMFHYYLQSLRLWDISKSNGKQFRNIYSNHNEYIVTHLLRNFDEIDDTISDLNETSQKSLLLKISTIEMKRPLFLDMILKYKKDYADLYQWIGKIFEDIVTNVRHLMKSHDIGSNMEYKFLSEQTKKLFPIQQRGIIFAMYEYASKKSNTINPRSICKLLLRQNLISPFSPIATLGDSDGNTVKKGRRKGRSGQISKGAIYFDVRYIHGLRLHFKSVQGP